MTYDGAAVNLSVLRSLGCKLDLTELDASFPHPVTKKPVFAMLDPCHMLKLLRNVLCDKKAIVNANKQFLFWKHINELHEIQYIEGLRLANLDRRISV